MERPEEARAQMDRALELDPLNLMFRTMNGGLMHSERRYAEAIEELEAVLQIEPDLIMAAISLVWAYQDSGKYDEAMALGRTVNQGDQELLEAAEQGYAEGGYRAANLRAAETLAARPGAADLLSMPVALTYAQAGERERTLEWLEKAYEARHYVLPGWLPASGLGPVPGDDPRYQALRQRMNLPTGPEGN
jgi:lipopolysaccharide biosynthesis regulator YciM